MQLCSIFLLFTVAEIDSSQTNRLLTERRILHFRNHCIHPDPAHVASDVFTFCALTSHLQEQHGALWRMRLDGDVYDRSSDKYLGGVTGSEVPSSCPRPSYHEKYYCWGEFVILDGVHSVQFVDMGTTGSDPITFGTHTQEALPHPYTLLTSSACYANGMGPVSGYQISAQDATLSSCQSLCSRFNWCRGFRWQTNQCRLLYPTDTISGMDNFHFYDAGNWAEPALWTDEGHGRGYYECYSRDDVTGTPTRAPLSLPSRKPTQTPSEDPSQNPSRIPSSPPTNAPSNEPTQLPSIAPSAMPTSCVPNKSDCATRCQSVPQDATLDIQSSIVGNHCQCWIETTVFENRGSAQGDLPIDLVIMIDATASMRMEIDALTDAMSDMIQNLFDDIFAATGFIASLRVAILGYRDPFDIQPEPMEILPFSSDLNEITNFLRNLQALKGGDSAEDVNGGFRTALDQDWVAEHRFILHVADSPGHGLNGPDSAGLLYQDLFEEINARGIYYIFARMSPNTDQMISLYDVEYAVSHTGAIDYDASIEILDLEGLTQAEAQEMFSTSLVSIIDRNTLQREIQQTVRQYPMCPTYVSPTASPTVYMTGECHISACGCPGSFLEAWCTAENSVSGPWCRQSEGSCGACGGTWCPMLPSKPPTPTPSLAPTTGKESGECRISLCGCEHSFLQAWCTVENSVAGLFCRRSEQNCGVCGGNWCPASSPTEFPTTLPTPHTPTKSPSTPTPTKSPTTRTPTKSPTTNSPTETPTASTTQQPTESPTVRGTCLSWCMFSSASFLCDWRYMCDGCARCHN